MYPFFSCFCIYIYFISPFFVSLTIDDSYEQRSVGHAEVDVRDRHQRHHPPSPQRLDRFLFYFFHRICWYPCTLLSLSSLPPSLSSSSFSSLPPSLLLPSSSLFYFLSIYFQRSLGTTSCSGISLNGWPHRNSLNHRGN